MRQNLFWDGLVLVTAALHSSSAAVLEKHEQFQVTRNTLGSLPNGDPINCGQSGTTNVPCWNTQNISYVDWCLQIDTGVAAVNQSKWRLQCRTDYYEQNIYAYAASEVSECFSTCLAWNAANWLPLCAAWVFDAYSNIDGRGATNCWLKGGVNDMELDGNITEPLVAASWITDPPEMTSSVFVTLDFEIPAITSIVADTHVASSTSSTTTASSLTSLTTSAALVEVGKLESPHYLRKRQLPANLTVINSTYLGVSQDCPATHYVQHDEYQVAELGLDLLQPGVNMTIVNDYPLAGDTGTWTINTSPTQNLSEMTLIPRLARDGGRGGSVNGTQVFIFCDTSTYGDTFVPSMGYLNGLVSSSIAVDQSMNALHGDALELVDPVGQWQDNVGRARGFSPMTTAEQAYNSALSGQGYRYAVWPDSSPISLNATHSLLYAPLVYLTIDMSDQNSRPNFTGLGNTLLLVHVDSIFGPHADRLKNQIFTENEVGWGSLGGFRAWTSTGPGSNDGYVYVFGQAGGSPIGGVMVGKVAAQNFTDRSQYVYWIGDSWSTEMPPLLASSNAFMVQANIMEMDLVYSPYHKTFIMIYLTEDTDNQIYYRFLVGKDNSALNIIPPYEEGGDEDYAEQIVLNSWSEQQVLLNIPKPERGYAYAGGIHAGYFGDDDITQGGKKMLLTWTEHTAVDPDVPNTGYALKAQIVEIDWT